PDLPGPRGVARRARRHVVEWNQRADSPHQREQRDDPRQRGEEQLHRVVASARAGAAGVAPGDTAASARRRGAAREEGETRASVTVSARTKRASDAVAAAVPRRAASRPTP